MRAGQRHWHMVTTDSAGVPHGGPYGRVEWFEKAAGRHGLKLGWSRFNRCFGVYTTTAGRHVFQFLCRKRGDKPIPLNKDLLTVLLYAWNRRRARRAANIMDWLVQQERDRKQRLMKQRYEEASLIMPDAVRQSMQARGLVGRRIISIPGRVG